MEGNPLTRDNSSPYKQALRKRGPGLNGELKLRKKVKISSEYKSINYNDKVCISLYYRNPCNKRND